MSAIKNSILALFDDNLTGAISAADMRIFVNAIFDSKENEIHVFDNLSDLVSYRTNPNNFVIQKFDIIIITDSTNDTFTSERGIYIALKDSPGEIPGIDVFKIAALNYDEFLKTGNTGQLISLDSNNQLTWIEPIEGYFIEGTDTITNILNKRPSQKGPIWISTNEELLAPVPGRVGDGYSWDGEKWNNIGPLRGPEGDVVEIGFANQYEVDSGYIDYKSVSPKTLKNSSLLHNKEDILGNPSNDGYVLISDSNGNRDWEKPVKILNDLDDVDYSMVDPESFLVYTQSGIWNTRKISDTFPNTFIGLSDTPSTFGGIGQAAIVNASKTGLTFGDIPKVLANLNDVSDSLAPQDGYILKYNGNTGVNKWTAVADTRAGTNTQRPQNPRIGEMFFDTTLKIPIWFDGQRWVDADSQAR